MPEKRFKLKRTVYMDEESGNICTCQGSFWKTCSLRVANQLPCKESIISVTPIERDEKDPASLEIRSIDAKLADLTDSLRHLKGKFKI